jgi:radical SAM superfamily enzyme YgiQ (UPF0313 family)
MRRHLIFIEPLVRSDLEPGLFTIGNSLEPYALELLAAAVEAHGYTAEIVRQGDMTCAQIASLVAARAPLCVGISVLTHTASRVRTLAAEIRAASPDTHIIVGGQHPSLDPEYLLSGCFDFAVLGEGEETLVSLLDFLSSEHPAEPAGVPGIAYRTTNSGVAVTAPRPRITNLDSLPLAKRMPSYLRQARSWNLTYPPPNRQTAVAQIGYSRGCRYGCTFCVSPVVWRDVHAVPHAQSAVRYRSARAVAREVRYLRDEFGVNYVYFTDLTFNDDRNRVAELCEALIAEGLHDGSEDDPHHQEKAVHWFALVKVGLDRETASRMARAGCSKIGIGVETFDTEQVESYRKPYRTSEELRESLWNADSQGIIVRCLLMIGAPEETHASIQRTIEGLKAHPIDQVRVAFLTPYPNTLAFTAARTELLTRDLDHFDENHPLFRCNGLTPDELHDARHRIVTELYASDEYLARCRRKLDRFPWLSQAYHWFLTDLFRRSGGKLDLLSPLGLESLV